MPNKNDDLRPFRFGPFTLLQVLSFLAVAGLVVTVILSGLIPLK